MMTGVEDITKNLPSLQFDSALHDEEKALLCLRSRSFAVISSACGQAAYFVAILNEARETIFDKTKTKYKSANYSPLKIGIIGCGRLGKQLATVFLEFGNLDACDLYISTRCPENLERFESKGVVCCFDNRMVSSTVDVLFLCCLPSQLHTVAKDLRGNLSCLVYSFVGGMSLAKISQLLNYQQIIKPSFIFRSVDIEKPDSNFWQFGRDITEVLQDTTLALRTCPFNSDEESLLEDDKKLCELFVFAFLNDCTVRGIGRREALRLCNSVMFGLSPNNTSCLTVDDILQEKEQSENKEFLDDDNIFPVFDLAKLSLEETLLGKKFNQQNEVLSKAFSTRYRKIFEK